MVHDFSADPDGSLVGEFEAGEKPEDKPPGFVMYMPIYEADRTLETVEQRRAALRGFVFAPFRVHDLMAGILGNNKQSICFAVFDGADETEAALLHDTAADTPGKLASIVSDYRQSVLIDIAGRTWTISAPWPPTGSSRDSSGWISRPLGRTARTCTASI